MLNIFFALILTAFTAIHSQVSQPAQHVLASKTMSMEDRYPVQSVNDVFKKNILLTLAYMKQASTAKPIKTDTIDQAPLHYEFTLHKGDTFAFHDDVLPAFKEKVKVTTHAHFNGQEGFMSDGYLMGDGVCHFASLIDYAAKTAGLDVVAPTSHDFANIPEVPKQYGVAIYTTPSEPAASAQQNLYVTNTFSQDVTMVFDYRASVLKVSILKQGS